MNLNDYYGRRLLVGRDDTSRDHFPALQVLPTIEVGPAMIRCLRCNHQTPKTVAALPRGEYYCPHCINLGRVSTLTKFYHVPEPNQFSPVKPVLTWQGTLSPFQQRAAEAVKEGMKRHCHQLLWAVTGAGKTEMMFAGIAAALERGERVAIASPRVDVCGELYPRLQAAFANCQVVLLHGHQPTPYRYAQLTICTTHQLLRFYRAFDNLIIDEVDAFPYAANPALLFATRQALKKDGGCLYLTATPGETLLREVRRHRLTVNYLPLRYHGELLPTIKLRLAINWRKQVKRQRISQGIIRQLRTSLLQGHRFLLFVPHVADLAPAEKALRKNFTAEKFTTVHATDPDRMTKVQQMRDGQYDFLITSTILERGVTFAGIDVYVLGADDEVFSSSALVQIAGRAGRSPQRPTGNVVFWIAGNCRNVRQAVAQIRLMNRKGRKLKSELSSLQ
ncbi:DEAD/DEAH box helicase [Limosilactobacillus caccae]|uniref:DEAD/DEAH box helicase n=1 Tax=Limosilactobacillus caccae TaxID=1926284 RepID=UPI0009710FC2|nr:helicase-related protein [Limosilactobacillus caccae]